MTPADVAEWRGGWRVVLGAATGMGAGIALYLLVASIFIEPLTQAFGWTRGDIGVGATLSVLVGAVMLPLIGRAIDRFGFRAVALVCAPALAAVYVALGLMAGAYWYYLALMAAVGVVGGGTSALVYMRPVIGAFERQRGLALGVSTAGFSIVAMLAPPLLSVVIGEYGWRAGFFALAALTGLAGTPLALVLIGRAREGALHAAHEAADTAAAQGDTSLREAVRGSRFWLLALAMVAINIPGAGVLGQLAPMVGDLGLTAGEVAAVMSTYAAGLFVGRLLTGFALDRFPAPAVGAVMTLAPMLGIVLLMAPSLSFALAVLAVGLIGVQQGSEVDLFGYFVSRSYGIKHFGTVYGVIVMAGVFSSAAALVLFPKIYDATGSYDLALTIGAVLFGLGALAFGAMARVR